MDDFKYYTIDEINKMTHLSKDSIRKLIRSGKLKGVKFGVRYLISERDLKEYIDNLYKKNKENE